METRLDRLKDKCSEHGLDVLGELNGRRMQISPASSAPSSVFQVATPGTRPTPGSFWSIKNIILYGKAATIAYPNI